MRPARGGSPGWFVRIDTVGLEAYARAYSGRWRAAVGLLQTLVVAICLGMDAFSVGLAVGGRLGRASARQAFRLAFHFGLFQFAMPLAGWALGRAAVGRVEQWDHWIAFGLLLAVGLHMIVEAVRGGKRLGRKSDPTRGWMLVGLSVATSIDALAVGVGFGVLRLAMFRSAVVIGAVAAVMTLIGLRSGGALRLWMGRRMEAIGGLVLIVLAVRMLTI